MPSWGTVNVYLCEFKKNPNQPTSFFCPSAARPLHPCLSLDPEAFMQRKMSRNVEIARHAAEKLDEVNKARFLRQRGITPPAPADGKGTAGGNKRAGQKVSA